MATTTVTLQMHTGSGWVSRDDGGDDDGLGHISVAQSGQPGGGGGGGGGLPAQGAEQQLLLR